MPTRTARRATGAIERHWTRALVISAMREWRSCYGRLPTSYDWSRAHARARGSEALERLAGRKWPAASVVSRLFGTWATARAAAFGEGVEAPQAASSEGVALIGHTGDLYAQSAEIACKMRRSAEVHELA